MIVRPRMVVLMAVPGSLWPGPSRARGDGASRERLSRRLHGGLARPAVLLVLPALPGVPALDFGRIRARQRHLDRPLDSARAVGVGAHRDDASSRIETFVVRGRR